MSEENKSEGTQNTQTVKLKPDFSTHDVVLERSQIKVTIPEDWHISDTQAAQRIAAGKAGMMQLALIQRVCLFNGERWTIGQIEEAINGRDYFQLLGEFFGKKRKTTRKTLNTSRAGYRVACNAWLGF